MNDIWREVLGHVVILVMLADMAVFFYETERGRIEAETKSVDGFIPVNRRLMDMARRQL